MREFIGLITLGGVLMSSDGFIAVAILVAVVFVVVFAIVKSSWVRNVIGKAITGVFVAALTTVFGVVVGIPVEASAGGGVAVSAVTLILSSDA
jgi:MFS superfamily sulfate permease-like transporter